MAQIVELAETYRPSFFCVTETRLDSTIHSDVVNIPRYTHMRLNRSEHSYKSASSGGVMLYWSAAYNLRNSWTEHGDDFEILGCLVETGNATCAVVTCYRSPVVHNFHPFMTALDLMLQVIAVDRKADVLYVTGDFNVNLLGDATDSDTFAVDMMFAKYGLMQTVRVPTRFPSKTLLDLIAVRVLHKKVGCHWPAKVIIMPDDVTDHAYVTYDAQTVARGNPQNEVIWQQYRNFSERNTKEFYTVLSSIKWDTLLLGESPETDYQIFWKHWKGAYEHCFPFEARKKGVYRIKFPAELVARIRQKRALYKKCRSETTWTDYKKIKNKLNRDIREFKIRHIEQELQSEMQGSKAWWTVVKRHIAGGNKKDSCKMLIIDNKEVCERLDIANAFASKFERMYASIDTAVDPISFDRLTDGNVLDTIDIVEDDILNIINSLKCGKVNLEGIPVNILKCVSAAISKPLLTIYSESLSTGFLPRSFKVARVTPIYKSGNPKSVDNYRPISVISIFAQIIERLVERQLYVFVDSAILPKCQFGFRKKHNTTHAALSLINNVLEKREIGKMTGVLFVDLSNAFPSADHDILLRKLHRYGIRGNIYNWLKAYLTDRTMTVHVDGTASRPARITRGVPQGSPLGPLLFSIYYADVVSAMNVCGVECSLFADDTEIHVSGNNEDEVVDQLNRSLVQLNRYLIGNKLELNTKKTVWMLMFEESTATKAVVYEDRVINRVSSFKYLGFIVDVNLHWQDQVNAVVSKVRRNLFCLWRSRYSMTLSGRLMLFNALIMPYFNYGIELWYATSKTNRGTLELLLRHCLRVVLNDVGTIPNISNMWLYTSLDVLPLSLMFQQRLAVMLYKVINRGACPAVGQIIDKYKSKQGLREGTLRNVKPFMLPFIKQESGRIRLAFYGCLLWNHIPSYIRDAHSETNFKSMYYAYLMDWFTSDTKEITPVKFYEYA